MKNKFFDLKINFYCNNDCYHCVVADKRKAGSLDFLQVQKIIDGLSCDVTGIVITGGEPSIDRNFLQILKYCKEKKLTVNVQTNGTGFADKLFCDECLPYMDNVLIAIHSCFPEVHDKIVRSKGMWEKTMLGFNNLLAGNVKIGTQTVVSKLNIMTVYDTYKMIQEMHPGTIMNLTYPHIMGNAMKYKDIIIFRYSEYKEEIQRILHDFGKYIITESIPYCYLYPFQDTIVECVEQNLLFEVYERVGVDFYYGLNEINYNEYDIEDRRKLPSCSECIFDRVCPGVWKEYLDCFHDRIDLYPIKVDEFNVYQ